MLKKYSVLRGFVILCVGLFVFCLPPLQAQDSDFVTWNKMKARHDVSSKVELYGDVEMRTRDALDEIDRWGFGVGTSVLLLPFLKAEGGYEYHYRNRGEDGWNPGTVIMQVSLSLSKNDNGRSPCANVSSILSTDAERMNSVSAPA